ncbi:hypothetical protein F2Q70_00038946 [Brassica cretica]|uniref:Uncharacterized protein n=1 Tax=Brassica cretica TaxID=69181 RepID=A0A8S9KAC0_BRACR|nr:hypothetical protein F2Q70_00038946 [Brassica cretica]KAF2617579.1 hypothetical protein F2Q68_00039634 [Brassica cretica]
MTFGICYRALIIGGEVTAAKGFNAGGMYDGLRASEEKPDLGIVTCDVDDVPAGSKLVMFVVLKWKNKLDKAQVADGGEFEGSMVEELWKKKNSEEAV